MHKHEYIKRLACLPPSRKLLLLHHHQTAQFNLLHFPLFLQSILPTNRLTAKPSNTANMVAFSQVLLFAAGASAAAFRLEARTTPAQVQTDLTWINGNTTILKNAINAWDGSLGGSVPIQQDESNLDSLIQASTNDAKASSKFSESQAQSSIAYINNTLEPNVRATLNALVARKSQIAADGLTGTVQNDLQSLKSDTDSFAAALIALAPSDQVSNAKAAQAKLDADFTSAINSFSS